MPIRTIRQIRVLWEVNHATATHPCPLPLASCLLLLLAAGDTYGIRHAALDRQRGLLYVLGRQGDASSGGGVLTVVDLAAGQVRATAPLPAAFGAFGPTPSLALSPDGTRLYVAGGEEPALLVLDTGAAARRRLRPGHRRRRRPGADPPAPAGSLGAAAAGSALRHCR